MTHPAPSATAFCSVRRGSRPFDVPTLSSQHHVTPAHEAHLREPLGLTAFCLTERNRASVLSSSVTCSYFGRPSAELKCGVGARQSKGSAATAGAPSPRRGSCEQRLAGRHPQRPRLLARAAPRAHKSSGRLPAGRLRSRCWAKSLREDILGAGREGSRMLLGAS